jgi:hypothetical protein
MNWRIKMLSLLRPRILVPAFSSLLPLVNFCCGGVDTLRLEAQTGLPALLAPARPIYSGRGVC